MLTAAAIGAVLAAILGYLFGADAEAIVGFFCISAVVFTWSARLFSAKPDEAQTDSDDRRDQVPLVTQEFWDAQPSFDPVLDALPIGVLIVDDAQQVIAANQMIREIFTLPPEPGYPVETLRAQRLLRAVEHARQTGESADFEMALSRRAEIALRVHVRMVSTALTSDSKLMIAVEDITQARMADAVHRDFVANASHELKTPLAVVSGLIETLQGPAKNDPVGTERFLGRLATQTQRMTRLIDDLMSLNRIELNQRVMPEAPHALTGLVAEAVDALRPAAEASDVTLVFDPDPNDASVLADREELGQLFGNLIDNAIKYGGKGGAVHIRIFGSEDGDEVAVSVTDEGPGIAREHLPRLTERFYRVDIGRSREQGGTGLGLAICKHIVNRHRGRIDVQSVVNAGTTFTVWFPSISASAASAR